MKDKTRRKLLLLTCLTIGMILFLGYGLNKEMDYEYMEQAKNYILANHTSETGALNAVTAIYLNYRLWDTLFEAMILMLSVLAVISFSHRSEHE
jgi:multicomponent Na+:H+ antiporter subunit B